MHEIKIYGEIVPFEEQWIIEQGGFYNLTTLQKSLLEAGGNDIKVRIRSFGGDVQTGFDIYNELRRYAKENNAKVQTLGEGFVASIATVIFLAGDERILTESTNPFVHNAWTYTWDGMDSKSFQRLADDLSKCDSKIAEHYALHTDLTKDEALELMNNDTSITPTEAVNMRFATSIEEVFRPVALKRFSKTNKINKMNKKTQSILAKAAKALGLISNKVVATADGTELDFYELADDAVIAVGDKAYFDGADAEGDFLMPDGETYVFVGGELTEILPVISDDSETDLAEANATIALLTDQLEKATNKLNEQEVLISNYKASSKPVNTVSKPAPRNAPVAKKENTSDSLDEKIKQASNLKLKK
jgi:ATP-dependent Clp protease protease subunit